MFGGWIFSENLRPLLETLAQLAGGEFDGDDWLAVEYALSKDGTGQIQWPLSTDGAMSTDGATTIELHREAGTAVVSLRLVAAPALEAQAQAVVTVMQDYVVGPRPAR
jgi:hypothetical protein